jgi:hypothetical protein
MTNKTTITAEKSVRQDSIKWWYSLSIDEQYEHADRFVVTRKLNVAMITPDMIQMLWFRFKREELIQNDLPY